jgi:hypothetical protein
MFKHTIFKSKYLLLMSIFAFTMNCGEKVPVKEMSLAKLEISRAVSVVAKK